MADQSDDFTPATSSPATGLETLQELQIKSDLDIDQEIPSFLEPTSAPIPPASFTPTIQATSEGTDKPHLGVNMERFQSMSHEIIDLKPLDTPPTGLQPLDFVELYAKKRRVLHFKMLAKGHRKAKRSTVGAQPRQSATIARQPWVCRVAEDQRDVSIRPSRLMSFWIQHSTHKNN